MRLFISVDIPKDLKEEIFNLQSKITSKTAKVNWVAKKNLHITLKFLGNVEDTKIEDIKNKLDKIKFKPFELRLDKFGFFNVRGDPSIMRITFNNDKELTNLQKEIDYALINDFPNFQKFTSHLTIGRIKTIKNKKELLEITNKFKFSKEPFLVNSFNLVESKLTKDGPKYYLLEEFKA